MYKNVVKRFIDIACSLAGILIFGIPMLIVAVIIKSQDPGPALFTQKRVGRKKNGEISYFKLYKFRSMKMSTPHDIPTHQLEDPEQYLLKCGKFIRRFSIDEIPQLFNILKGDMSIIGPRPALWNQDDLVAEREKYGANDCRPGLTGWAQINGRDELEIPVKARYDGEYAQKLNEGGFVAFGFDCRCFFGTFLKVFRAEGVVEGGTGEMKKAAEKKAR